MQPRTHWTKYRFFIYGFLGGILFLLIGIWMESNRNHLPLTLWSLSYLHRTVPMIIMLDMAPLVFGTLVGLMGLQGSLQSTLQRAKKEWEVTFDASVDPIFVIDEQNRIIRCNRAVIDRLKATFPDVVGKQLADVLGRGPTMETQQSVNQKNEFPWLER